MQLGTKYIFLRWLRINFDR